MASTTNASKKPKTSDEDDFEVLRRYILDCPHFSKAAENTAVKAALSGLERERKRHERDAKLQRKFSQENAAASSATTVKDSQTRKSASDDVMTTVKDPTTSADDEDFMDEWEDVAEARNASSSDTRGGPQTDEDGVEIIDAEEETNFLGQTLAEISISSIAESHVKARTPVAAVALALHAAMQSEILGFACTGIPEENDKKSNGFAAPVRELPRGQFLPRDWDKYAFPENDTQKVALRYRKDGIGSVHLKVEKPKDARDVSVKLLPANTQEPPTESLVFPIDQHVNLDSWTAALRVAPSGVGVEPALHYKGLPALLSSYVKTFDLGSIKDTRQEGEDQGQVPFFPPMGVTPPTYPNTGFRRDDDEGMASRFGPPITTGDPSRDTYDDRGPTIDNSFPQHRPMMVGDFSGDLNPGGGLSLDPYRRAGPDMSGNLMGPNHPAFHGDGMVGPPGGRFGMKPRFDPFGPPGGPQQTDPDTDPNGDPNNPNGRRVPPHLRPARSGDPNPDHLPPPNSLGNNMFM